MEPRKFSRADYVLLGAFVTLVIVVIVLAFVINRETILVPEFEVVSLVPAIEPKLR